MVAKLFAMLGEHCLVWNVRGLNSRARRNVRGLNSRARRNVVRELVDQENISLISLQETKLDVCSNDLVREICGANFDYVYQASLQHLWRDFVGLEK